MRRNYFWPLFFICASTISLEVAMLRFFAVESSQSFGAMIISIALLGFGVSGTVLTIFRDFFSRNIEKKLFIIALAYLISLAIVFVLASLIPFNPNKMLNPAAIPDEVLKLLGYFLVFFVPFFFGGLYTGLCFVRHHEAIGKIYFFDLVGASFGGLSILAVMFFLNPLFLVAYVAVLATVAFLISAFHAGIRWLPIGLAFVALAADILVFGVAFKADYHIYKPISLARQVWDNRPLLTKPLYSPIGVLEVLANSNEKANLPLSDEFSRLVPKGKVPDIYPGLYIDGNRSDGFFIANDDSRFIRYNLYAAPFLIKHHPEVLNIGAGGGFTTAQAYELGAKKVTIVEANPFVVDLLQHQFAKDNRNLFNRPDQEIIVNDGRSFTLRDKETYDLLSITDSAIAARPDENYLLTVDAFADYAGMLKQNGILTASIDAAENFYYGLRLINNVKAYHDRQHLNPANRVVVLRSMFKLMIMVKNGEFSAPEIRTLTKFCSDLGFDAIYYPGVTGEEPIFNSAPYTKIGAHDRVDTDYYGSEQILKYDQFFELVRSMLKDDADLKDTVFDYTPTTDDRPYFFSLIRPTKVGESLQSYELGGLPQQEVSSLIIYADFAIVTVLALIVVAIPFIAQFIRRKKQTNPPLPVSFYLRSLTYFACLGLGFLFIELVLIQKLAHFLGDIVYSFSIVLASILVFAGLGSYFSERLTARPRLTIAWAAVLVVIGIAYIVLLLPILIRSLGVVPFPLRILLSFVFSAPVAVPLGCFFPIGLGQLQGDRARFVPWAWSINGAFSVISTIGAKILSQTFGFTAVLIIAAGLYVLAALVFPRYQPAKAAQT